MNPLLTLITDYNPSWVGIVLPETPSVATVITPCPRITNMPDLPQDEEVLFNLGYSLDLRLELIMAGSPSLASLSPEQAGHLQEGNIIHESVKIAHELAPPKRQNKTGKG